MIKADPVTTTWEDAKELNFNHSTVVGIWSKLEMWKSSIRSASWADWKIKSKIIIVKCCLSFYAMTTNHFSMRLWHARKSRLYMTTRDRQLNGWAEKKLESPSHSKTCTKKKSWSPFGCLLLLWSIRAFWIPEKPLYLRHMLSKSMRCTKNPCNARSQYWSTERSHSSPLHCQITCSTTYTSKVGWIGLKFSLTCHIHLTSYQLTTTSSSFSKAFCREKTSTISKRQKMLSKSSSNSEAWIFIATGISKLFFFGKNLLTVMVLILINKDMFESTYDLKFMAPNCNYICTKLIFFYPS